MLPPLLARALGGLLDRLRARAAEDPPITEQQVQDWALSFDPPDEAEGSTWDLFEIVGPEEPPRPPIAGG